MFAYNILKSRDDVEELLNKGHSYSSAILATIINLDNELKKQARRIAHDIDLNQCRVSLNPPIKNWWWFIDENVNQVWRTLTIICTYLTIAGMSFIAPRIFKGGTDFLGSIYSIILIFLASPGVKSLFHYFPKTLDQFFVRIGIPSINLNKVTLGLSTSSLLIVVITILMSPKISEFYQNRGLKYYKSNYLGAALDSYNRSLAWESDNTTAHFYIGLINEDLQNTESAISAYQTAEKSCKSDNINVCARTRNNLSRLYIKNKNYDSAISLLNRQEIYWTSDDVLVNFSLKKNKGWALYIQTYLLEAESILLEAIDIAKNSTDIISKSDAAAAYCLYAQVLDKLSIQVTGIRQDERCIYWDKCFEDNDRYLPEEISWHHIAQKKYLECKQ